MRANEFIVESISTLDSHNIIALDFDETLVYHPKSERLWSYIESNPTKKFYIVTMRHTAIFNEVWSDLDDATYGSLSSDNFVEAISASSSDDIADYALYSKIKKMNNPRKQERILSNNGITMEEVDIRLDEITSSKALICKRIGATILVDDMKDMVINGCDKYSIMYMHPNEL